MQLRFRRSSGRSNGSSLSRRSSSARASPSSSSRQRRLLCRSCHLGLRAQVAANRDKFDASNLKTRQLFKVGRLQTKKGANLSETVFYLRIDLPFAEEPGRCGRGVAIRLYEVGHDSPRQEQEGDREPGPGSSLRAVLQAESARTSRNAWRSAQTSGRAGDLDPDAFAVKAPGVLEIPLPAAAVAALQGKQLLVECELDPKGPTESAFHLQASGSANGRKRWLWPAAELLIRPESKTAKDFTASGERFVRLRFQDQYFYVNSRSWAGGRLPPCRGVLYSGTISLSSRRC